MSNEKIDVDVQVLEEEISNLISLKNDIEANKVSEVSIEGTGYTVEFMKVVNDGFETLIKNFEVVVSETISLLENAKDGYIDVEESASEFFNDFKNEVLKNE